MTMQQIANGVRAREAELWAKLEPLLQAKHDRDNAQCRALDAATHNLAWFHNEARRELPSLAQIPAALEEYERGVEMLIDRYQAEQAAYEKKIAKLAEDKKPITSEALVKH